MSVASTLVSLPVAIWTVALGVWLVYWLFVMVGVIHLGEGSEGALEGGAKGAAEALGHGLDGGGHDLGASGDVADGGDGGDFDGADGGDGGHGEPTGLAALLGAKTLRKVPATLSLSLLTFYAWATSLLLHLALHATLSGEAPSLYRWLATLVVAPLVAFPLTALTVRPLAPLFSHKTAKSAKDLVGKVCVVRTGEVTETFGEAVMKDTGADLVLRVRVDGSKLKRGEEALIVGWDAEREEYLVEPLEQELYRSRPKT